MTQTSWIVCGVVIVAIAVVLVIGRGLGWFKLSLFGKAGFSAGRTKPSPGAFAEDVDAGRDLRVRNEGPGTASANRSVAGQDIDVTNTQKDQPKKGKTK